jgi:arylamine N-acetyltransferase
MDSHYLARYLRLLGVEGPVSGLSGLERIVMAHVCRVPFENVSKLLLIGREGMGRPTRLGEFLDGMEHRDLGGTCYSNNPFLVELLRALGYDADLLGADMSAPNVHTVIRVRLDSAEWHVDAGYGGPFWRPVRLDQLPKTVASGELRFVFHRSAEDHVEMSLMRGESRLHGYMAHGPARSFDFFHPIILRSFEPGQHFMTNLRVIRHFEDRRAAELLNSTLTLHRDGESRVLELRERAELRSAVANELAMPRCPIDEAVDVLERMSGQMLFQAK